MRKDNIIIRAKIYQNFDDCKPEIYSAGLITICDEVDNVFIDIKNRVIQLEENTEKIKVNIKMIITQKEITINSNNENTSEIFSTLLNFKKVNSNITAIKIQLIETFYTFLNNKIKGDDSIKQILVTIEVLDY